jgi:hypothetical protein
VSETLTEAVLHDVPPEYRDRATGLLDLPSVSSEALHAELDEYVTTVKQVAVMVELLDVDMALKLAGVVRQLLSVEGLDAEQQRLVQLAAHYLVREEDDEEVTGVLGFDDDIQVINAVSRGIGRADLVVPLPSVL